MFLRDKSIPTRSPSVHRSISRRTTSFIEDWHLLHCCIIHLPHFAQQVVSKQSGSRHMVAVTGNGMGFDPGKSVLTCYVAARTTIKTISQKGICARCVCSSVLFGLDVWKSFMEVRCQTCIRATRPDFGKSLPCAVPVCLAAIWI